MIYVSTLEKFWLVFFLSPNDYKISFKPRRWGENWRQSFESRNTCPIPSDSVQQTSMPKPQARK